MHRGHKRGPDDSYLELGEGWKNEVSVTTAADPGRDSNGNYSDPSTVREGPERDGIMKTMGVKVAAQ